MKCCEYSLWGLKCASLCVGPGIARKHWTRLKKLGGDKHASLLWKSVNYSHSKFYSAGPWLEPGLLPLSSCIGNHCCLLELRFLNEKYIKWPSLMKHVFQSVVIWRNEAGLLNKSLASPSSVTYICQIHRPCKVKTGNTNWEGRPSTIGLLIKVACF